MTTDIYEDNDVDKDELERDKIIEDIIIYAVPPSDCRIQMQDGEEVEKEVREKFSSIGVEVREMQLRSSRKGTFESSLVKITPTNLRKIWGRRLSLKNCAVIEYKKSTE